MSPELSFYKRIAVPQQFGWVFLKVQEILAVEAARSYCTFYCHAERRITVSRSLAWAEEQLHVFGFIRTHRSWLVNLYYVEEYSRKEGIHLKLSNGLDVPVSAMYRDQLLGQLVDNYSLAPVDGNGHWGGQIRHWEDRKGD
jgi:two-component system LytT family response regulator